MRYIQIVGWWMIEASSEWCIRGRLGDGGHVFGCLHSLTQKPRSRFGPCRGGLILDGFQGVFLHQRLHEVLLHAIHFALSVSGSLTLVVSLFFSDPIVHSPKTGSRGKCAKLFHSPLLYMLGGQSIGITCYNGKWCMTLLDGVANRLTGYGHRSWINQWTTPINQLLHNYTEWGVVFALWDKSIN